VSLAFVALAQCKQRHYSALATYLSLEIPVVPHPGCVSAAGMDEGNAWNLLIFKTDCAVCLSWHSAGDLEMVVPVLSWQKLGTRH